MDKFIASVCQKDQIETILNSSVFEIIICMKYFSKTGSLNIEDVKKIIIESKIKNKKISFAWDIIHTQNQLDFNLNLFKKYECLHKLNLRILDVGVLNIVLKQCSNNIDLILQTSLNYYSINSFVNYINNHKRSKNKDDNNRLNKIILSTQMDYVTCKEIFSKINFKIELETLYLGRPEIFYSPRSLVQNKKEIEETLNLNTELLIDSVEFTHKNFVVKESARATLMYYSKNIFLQKSRELLLDLNILNFRIDFNYIQFVPQLLNDPQLEIKDIDLKNSIQGFFKTNKTDVLFKKLKNNNLAIAQKNAEQNQEIFIANVIDVCKKKYIVLEMKKLNILQKNDVLIFYTPDKKRKEMVVYSMKNLKLNTLEKQSNSEYILLPHVSSVCVKSICYKKKTIKI